ncbi:MAG: hypothetical protein KDD42_02395 [Bdellovibrionales bacterium]|nr:hypothetical protein [Bdellovibrionales bacterium]
MELIQAADEYNRHMLVQCALDRSSSNIATLIACGSPQPTWTPRRFEETFSLLVYGSSVQDGLVLQRLREDCSGYLFPVFSLHSNLPQIEMERAFVFLERMRCPDQELATEVLAAFAHSHAAREKSLRSAGSSFQARRIEAALKEISSMNIDPAAT